MSAEPTCSREGCDNPLPQLAIAHGDEWCSNTCVRLHLGIEVPKPRTLAQINSARGNPQPKAPVPRERNAA